jgi:3-dehydroquinate synthase
MGDGERFKSLRTTEKALQSLAATGLQRDDAVVALGGGVVGDLAGFVAATYLRGIRMIQIPTTLLSQIDSSVGGKTGVNLPVGKNLVGSFHQPAAVIVDIETLNTLPPRELIAGWCEAVKQAAVSSRQLFRETTRLLRETQSGRPLISPNLGQLIGKHCAFKASIVKGDEREDQARTDRKSRKILNFGHTVGHALEVVTSYRRFRHGEAVGHGILVAGEISKNLGLLERSELELLRSAVSLCGPLPSAKNLNFEAVIDAIEYDKKRLGKNIQWVLLQAIGNPKIVDAKEIKPAVLRESLRNALGCAR